MAKIACPKWNKKSEFARDRKTLTLPGRFRPCRIIRHSSGLWQVVTSVTGSGNSFHHSFSGFYHAKENNDVPLCIHTCRQ